MHERFGELMGGTYTLTTLLSGVRDLLKEDSADFWTDAQLTRLINDAERDIAIRTGCIKSIDTLTATVNTRLISFTGYKVGYLEYATTGLGLMRIFPGQVGRIPTDGKTPEKWFKVGSDVGIEPIPDVAYSLNAYVHDKPSAEMSAGGNAPKVSSYAQFLIILHTLSNALRKEKRYSQATQILSIYENGIEFLTNDIEEFMPESQEQFASDRSAGRAIGV